MTSAQPTGAGSKVSTKASPFGRRAGRGGSPLTIRAPAAHWIDFVADAVAGVEHVVAAAAVDAVDAGLAEDAVAGAVADQDVVVEGALHVLVGAGQAHRVAAADRVDPGLVPGEGDVEQAGVGLGLGEGGVVAARAADDLPAGAAAPRGQQVAVLAAVEEGRARDAADQAVGAGAAVEPVAAEAGLDQVVLGTAFDRVVAEAAGEADAADFRQRAFDARAGRCRGRGRPSASAPGRRRRR